MSGLVSASQRRKFGKREVIPFTLKDAIFNRPSLAPPRLYDLLPRSEGLASAPPTFQRLKRSATFTLDHPTHERCDAKLFSTTFIKAIRLPTDRRNSGCQQRSSIATESLL